MPTPILELQNLSQYYTSAQSVVMGLDHLNLQFFKGEFVAITGESGSGKSTLARVIAGIIPYESGELLISGHPTSHYDGTDWEKHRSNIISFISQSYDILPGCTVLQNVVSALRLVGMEKHAARQKSEEILRKVDLWELRSRHAAKLSSGQKQRLSIARALAKPSPILIADEPTGNLDAENSKQIIRLLADAAKERLVLLITHEFEEAADIATRRISLKNGSVEFDRTLKTVSAEDVTNLDPIKNQNVRGLSVYTAALQLRSRPVWSAIMLGFFALTAFAVFAFLGTFIVHLDDTYTRIYDNSAFLNGNTTRIVVERLDGEPMSADDYNKLINLEYVEKLERYGYVADVNYAYREDIDYLNIHGLESSGLGSFSAQMRLTFTDTENFMKTVPIYSEPVDFLTAGRLPETMYEVVAIDGEYSLGDMIRIYVQDRKNWSYDTYIQIDAEVVGLTNQGRGLYFADQLAEIMTNNIMGSDLIILPNYTADLSGEDFEHMSFAGKFLCSSRFFQQKKMYIYQNVKDETMAYFYRFGLPDGEHYLDLKYADISSSTYMNLFEVSPDIYAQLTKTGLCDQLSLTIEDYAYTDRVLKEIGGLGYAAISPYQEGSARQNSKLAAQRLQTLKVCLITLAAVIVLQIFLLRAMFGMQMENYQMLSSIGLSRRIAFGSIFWQILILSAVGQLVAAGAILLGAAVNIQRIVHILRYLPTIYILLLSVIHFSVSFLTTLWILRVLRRQVYPFGKRYSDLNMENYPIEVIE